MKYIKIMLLLILNTTLFGDFLIIDDKTDFYDLLSNSKIYKDSTKSLTFEDIQNKNIKFEKNENKLLGFGYSPDFNIWVKFTLRNDTNKNIEKIIEYDNSMTTHITFYDVDENKVYQDGILTMNENRRTLNPIFKIKLGPYDSKTYYIKASSYIMTLIVKLNLWDTDAFYEKEIHRQFFLALFFGSMFILAFYNLFIYFFTKDISYMFYVLYIFGVIFHHLMYVGMAHVYIIKHEWLIYTVKYAALVIVFPIFSLALFSKTFLHIKQYPRSNAILNVFLLLVPLSLIVFMSTDIFNKYRNLFTMGLLFYLIYLTIYAAVKKNRQAYFILVGWFIILVASMFMYLASAGIFNIYLYYPYLVETAFVLEATIFSIALADRINNLQKEKNEANKKLILHQQNEKERLETKVAEKTEDLKRTLDEKGLLLKELNHRVKNNMQTIVSLIRLQSDDIDDEKVYDIFVTIQNRINAMGHLHDLLYKQDNITHINAYEYFDILIEEVRESYDGDIDIGFDINADLKIEQAIYCGLILNELITNSFKYAFPNGIGNIDISLEKDGTLCKLIVQDDGIGYDKSFPSNSLGLTLVNTLAKEQLRGDIKTSTNDGVRVEVIWDNS